MCLLWEKLNGLFGPPNSNGLAQDVQVERETGEIDAAFPILENGQRFILWVKGHVSVPWLYL